MSSLNMIPVKNIFILSKNCIEVSECNLGFRAHFLILASNGLEAFLGPRPIFTFVFGKELHLRFDINCVNLTFC